MFQLTRNLNYDSCRHLFVGYARVCGNKVKFIHQRITFSELSFGPMAVTPELIYWLGIVLVLGNKLPRKVMQWPKHFWEVGNDCQWNSILAYYAAKEHYVATWRQREHYEYLLKPHRVPQSHSKSNPGTTKQRNGERIVFNSNHPHRHPDSLRGRLGVGDHLGKIPTPICELLRCTELNDTRKWRETSRWLGRKMCSLLTEEVSTLSQAHREV